MKQIKQRILRIEDLPSLVEELYQLKDRCKIFTFTGSLGAGKTTLVQGILRRFGIEGRITSPTFNYMNIYETNEGQLLYHFDLYRIHSLEEFIGAGFNECLYAPDSWVFIEWPEMIMPLLTHKVCHITLEYRDTDSRLLDRVILD